VSAARTIVAIDPNGSHSFTAASQPGSCCAGNTTGLNPNITKISVVASSCAVIGWVTPCAMARPMSTPVRQVNSMAGTTMGVMVRCRRRVRHQVVGAQRDPPGCRPEQPDDLLHQGGLACAVRAERAVHLSRRHVQRYLVVGPDAVRVDLGNAGCPEPPVVAGHGISMR